MCGRHWLVTAAQEGVAGDLPGGPVVRTPRSQCRGAGSIPGQGTKAPQAVWPQKKKRTVAELKALVTGLPSPQPEARAPAWSELGAGTTHVSAGLWEADALALKGGPPRVAVTLVFTSPCLHSRRGRGCGATAGGVPQPTDSVLPFLVSRGQWPVGSEV